MLFLFFFASRTFNVALNFFLDLSAFDVYMFSPSCLNEYIPYSKSFTV